jgi:flagellar protein FlgJ
MSISQLSGITPTVSPSADPAAANLRRLQSYDAARTAGLNGNRQGQGTTWRSGTAATTAAPGSAEAKKRKQYQEFEAFALQSFTQSMMPQNSARIYGSGTAGEVWKSMLAEQIGREMAKHGGIGIAASVEKQLNGGKSPDVKPRDAAAGFSNGIAVPDRIQLASLSSSVAPAESSGELLGSPSGLPSRFGWLSQVQAADWNDKEAATGLPLNFIATNANIESGGKPHLRDPGNSNMGLHQFEYHDMHELLGYAASPLDPQAATDALVIEARRNQSALSSVLGHEPSGGELYVAHQQGTTGAKALFSAPHASAVDVLEGVYGNRRTAMRAIRLNIPSDNALRKQDVNKITAKQFTDLWVTKFNRQASEATRLFAGNTKPAEASVQPMSNRAAMDSAGQPLPRFLSANLSPHTQDRFLSRLAPASPAGTRDAAQSVGA